ncbi:MAG TPA: DUF3575 domain-containing protein [Dysgonomonas sp.]|nr:DUF3575 domain-containing protein [Dysgonomonas sp.]
MTRGIFLICLLAITLSGYSQHVGIKNNLIYDATLTPNLGLEIALGKKTTLDVNVGYNPFTFDDGKKFKHWLVQPELRWWICESFNRAYWGIHAHGGEFDVAGDHLPFGVFPNLKGHRYEGYFYGGGLSFGYQWPLGNRWNIEASLGAGYTRIHYEKYKCQDCGPLEKEDNYNYWGVTKASISFIYFIF